MAPRASLPAPGQAPIDALRFVDNEDRPRGPDQINRFLPTRLLAVLIEIVDILLIDGADRHHHDLDLRAGGEIPHLPEFRRVVEEILEGRSRVECPKVVVRDLERFVDTLFNRNRRHDDDEFVETVAFIQLENRAQVDVRLAGPRLHLYGKVTGVQGVRGWHAVAKLDILQVLQDFVVEQGEPVANSKVILSKNKTCLTLRSLTRNGELGATDLLTRNRSQTASMA